MARQLNDKSREVAPGSLSKKMSPVRRALAWHRALPTPVPVASEHPVVTQPEASLPFRLLPREAAALCDPVCFASETHSVATLCKESRRDTRLPVGDMGGSGLVCLDLFWLGVLRIYSKPVMRSIPGTGCPCSTRAFRIK